MTFYFNGLVSNSAGHVDGSPVGHALTVLVIVLSCGRLGFSCTVSIPFRFMEGKLV